MKATRVISGSPILKSSRNISVYYEKEKPNGNIGEKKVSHIKIKIIHAHSGVTMAGQLTQNVMREKCV